MAALLEEVDELGANHMSKLTRASFHRQSSKRGRRRPSADAG